MLDQRWAIVLIFLVAACGGVSAGDGDGSVDAGAVPDAQLVEPNIVFATSSTHDSAFGGGAVADSICALSASEAGLSGTYVAWLSGPTTTARDKIGGASGWVRVDGKPFVNTVDDLLAGRIFYPVSLNENGNRVYNFGPRPAVTVATTT